MDLQLALLILGVILILMIFAASRYPEFINRCRQNLTDFKSKRSRKSEQKLARETASAPIISDEHEHIDPADDHQFDFSGGTEQSSQGPDEMLFEDVQNEPSDQPEEEIVSLKALDEEAKPTGPFASLRQIDYWIKLSPASPKKKSEILDHLEKQRKTKHTVQFHVLTQEDPHWENLEDLEAEVLLNDVVASYQLLERGKASDLEELRNFDTQISELGRLLIAEKLMMATPEQALAQSLKLAEFYNSHQHPLEVSIRAPKDEAFVGKLVETSAKQQGLDFSGGEYVRLKKMGTHDVALYRMIAQDGMRFDQNMSSDARIKEVTFTMMPALSQSPGRDAKEMLDAVKAFSSRVKGEIRIPGVKEFHLDQLLNLRNHVSKLEKEIIDAGLEPGGQEMRRIFS